MLISENGDTEKTDNSSTKMNSVDLNNVDAIREKTTSLNAQKIKNINNLMQLQSCDEKEKSCCNDELKKHISILFITLFLLTFVGSIACFCFITFTNKFNEGIVENLVLKNGTKSMKWWKNSPIQPLLKVYIFNYTNIDDVLSGRDKKIKVKEVGPYVYKEFGQRVNLEYLENHKITFNDNKTVVYMPELSNGRSEDDIVKVANIPLLAALGKGKNQMESAGLDLVLRVDMPKEFHEKTIKEFLFGYSDSFTEKINVKPEKAGLLGSRKGVSRDNLTIHTGEDSLDNLGKIYAMNGQTNLSIWDSDECNGIDGTEGSQFPPHLMDKDEELKIFIKSFCRTLKLRYDSEVSVLNGIPAWRYKTPENEFGSSIINPGNECYCDAQVKECPPNGVFDASKCLDGIPLLISYPHFMEGEPSLRENFEGLNPDRSLHETYADIHPRMAFPIGGASRLQMNFRVTSRSLFFSKGYYTQLPKDLILPIFWFEVTAGVIPPEFQSIVFHTTQTANATYLAIQCGSLFAAFVSLLLLLSSTYIYFVRLMKKPSEKIQNKDVIVTYKTKMYPSLSSSTHQNTHE